MLANVYCPYCSEKAALVFGTEIYGEKVGPEAALRQYWLCRPCDAYVGVHATSHHRYPLGRLANAELRQLRIEAHQHFDPLWEAMMSYRGWSRNRARTAAYAWLAKELNISIDHAHMGWFDADMCRRVIQICSRVRVRPSDEPAVNPYPSHADNRDAVLQTA